MGQTIYNIGHENYDIGILNRHLGLLLDQLSDDPFWVRLQTASVQQYEMKIIPPGVGH